jgi:molybdopterin-guanine dinucleotide biosynthesis protein A
MIKQSAVILAGGQSSRMGRNKAFVELRQRPLIALALEKLAAFEHIIISTNESALFEKSPALDAYSFTCVPDIVPEQGPLGGIHAALVHCVTERLLVIPCDMPLLPPALLEYMATTASADICAPCYAGTWQPLCSVWHKNCIAAIEENLAVGKRSPLSLLHTLNTQPINEQTLHRYGNPDEYFANINNQQTLRTEFLKELMRLCG